METIKKLTDVLTNFELEKDTYIMEVCGTHTTEFFKTGVKDLFPPKLHLVDGPGCPVCVTDNIYLDRIIEIGKKYNPILTTFGDMIKVPSSYSSLKKEKSQGMDIEIVYSPIESLEIAKNNPDREVIFLSVGFETTVPTEAQTVLLAKEQNITNFSIFTGNKLTPPAVRTLLDAEEVNLDGFILPGHVCAVTGVEPWEFISKEYNKPTVITGFEAEDLIAGVVSLLNLIKNNDSKLINRYHRVVKENGNSVARDIMFKVFEQEDTPWRGIGIIPKSGLKLKEEFQNFDAEKKFPVTPPEPKEHPGCRCGELLRGLISPYDCSLFGKACVPENPVGPCMVSTEGPCAAYYKYGRK